MNRNQTQWLGGALVVGALVGGWWALGHDRVPSDDDTALSDELAPSDDDATIPAASYVWQAGQRHVLDVEWTTSSRTHIVSNGQGSALDGSLAFEGSLALDVVEVYGDGAMRGRLTVLDVRDGSHMQISNTADVGTDELRQALTTAELWVALGACGDVRELGATSAGQLGAETLRTLWQDARFTICDAGGDAQFMVAEATPHGIADVAYRVDGSRVAREGASYRSLRVAPNGAALHQADVEGHARVEEGRLVEMTARETLTVDAVDRRLLDVETQVTIRAVGAEPVVAAYADDIEWTTPDRRPLSRDVQEQLLEQRAAGLTAAQVVERTAAHAGADGPAYREFMWRAPARIALDGDAVVPALVAHATDPTASVPSVELALDLLAQAGTAQATQGLVAALSDAQLAETPRFPLYLQRATLVADPTPELITLVGARMESPDSDTAWAARYAIGSMVAALDAHDRGAEADPWHAQLAQGLAAESSADAREHRVRALANAERRSDLPALLALIDDPHAGVRRAVATSLEMMPGSASLAGLLRLAFDTDDMVQRTALLSLRPQPIAARDLTVLRDIVESDALDPRNERTMIEVLAQVAPLDPDAAQEVADMLAVTTQDAQVVAAAESLRAWLETAR